MPPKQTFYGDQFGEDFPLQVRINASSLSLFKQCPERYRREILLGGGKGEEDPDTTFGVLFHEALGLYKTNKARGASHSLALRGAFRWLLRESWDASRRRPKASLTSHPTKNRSSLLRTLVWYLDHYQDDPYQTYLLPSGAPAIEVQFEFDSGIKSPSGKEMTFVGTIDEIVQDPAGRLWGRDTKTSGERWPPFKFLSPENFSPGVQFSLYSVALKVCFGIEASGFILDAVEVGPVGSRFSRSLVPKPPGVLEEWVREQWYWVGAVKACAQGKFWPHNDATCGLYGGCPHRGDCAKAPKEREEV